MARIRTIKPEFWSSPSMAGANPWVRLLFIAMWNWADDSGRGTANVKELAAFAFPHDDDPEAPTAAELPSLLTEIRGRFHVVFYEVGGRRFYAIPSWDRHQRNERRAKSRFPAPEDGIEYDLIPSDQQESEQQATVTELPTHRHGTSDAPDGSSGPGTGEQGNRGTKDSSSPASRATAKDDDPDFAKFWSVYPRKVGKGEARKAWLKLVKAGIDPADIIAGAERYRDDPKRQRSEIEFTKHPGPWLNAERWTDILNAPQQSQPALEWWEN